MSIDWHNFCPINAQTTQKQAWESSKSMHFSKKGAKLNS